MDDIRFAWRRLRKQPLAAIASVLTLACAIGAGGATWSLLAPMPESKLGGVTLARGTSTSPRRSRRFPRRLSSSLGLIQARASAMSAA